MSRRSAVKEVAGEGVRGWLCMTLQITTRILIFILSKTGTVECFKQKNDRIWLRFYQGHSGHWVENTAEGQREALFPSHVTLGSPPNLSVPGSSHLLRDLKRIFLSPTLPLNFMRVC